MHQKALTAVIFVLVGLLMLVVFVGLIQQTLDTTGLALALVPVIGGLIGGVIMRGPAKGKDKDEGGDSP